MDRQPGTSRLRPGPHDREIVRLALPALAALAAEPVYVLVDTFVAGRLGTAQLAGVAVATTTLLAAYAVFVLLSYSTTAVVARLVGAGDRARAAAQAAQSLWLALGVGLVATAAGLALAGPLVDLFGAIGPARGFALDYLRVSLLGLPALVLSLAALGYLRGTDDTRGPLAITAVSVVVKVALELVLVLWLGHGLAAAALTTVVAQWVAAALYLAWLRRALRGHAVALRPDRATLGRLTTVAGDLFAHGAAMQAAFLVAALVAARIGLPDLAAHQVAFEVWVACTLVIDSVAVTGHTIVSRHLGAGQHGVARAAARRTIGWGLGVGAVLGVVVLALRPVLPGWFTDDPLVAGLVGLVLVFVAVIQPLNGAALAIDADLVGAGDVAFLKWATLGAVAVFCPLAVLVLAYGGGLGWLWAALLLLVALRLVALAARLATGTWLARPA